MRSLRAPALADEAGVLAQRSKRSGRGPATCAITVMWPLLVVKRHEACEWRLHTRRKNLVDQTGVEPVTS